MRHDAVTLLIKQCKKIPEYSLNYYNKPSTVPICVTAKFQVYLLRFVIF